MSDYTERTVVLTGATGALGAGLAAAFTNVGTELIGVDRAMPDARAAVDGVRYETADLTDDGQVGALFGAIGAPWAVVHTVRGFAPHTPLAALDPGEPRHRSRVPVPRLPARGTRQRRRAASVTEGSTMTTRVHPSPPGGTP
jgi:NAD(P)-dependent dehydrogenase (short-subunit alcohol dehydrogenase family)